MFDLLSFLIWYETNLGKTCQKKNVIFHEVNYIDFIINITSHICKWNQF